MNLLLHWSNFICLLLFNFIVLVNCESESRRISKSTPVFNFPIDYSICTNLFVRISSDFESKLIKQKNLKKLLPIPETIWADFSSSPVILLHLKNLTKSQNHVLFYKSLFKSPILHKSQNCFNGFLIFQNRLYPKLSLVLSSLMILFIPSTKFSLLVKNRDKLITITQRKETLEEVMLSEFGQSFKYKIGTFYDPITRNDDEAFEDIQKYPKLFSACKFCVKTGIFVINLIPIPLDDQKSFKILHNWPDYESNMNQYPIKLMAALKTASRFNFALINGTYKSTTGLMTYFFSHIQGKLNFTYILKPTDTSGLHLPNGTWTGQIGGILSGGIDIGAVAAETYQRSLVAEFSPAVFYEPVIIISGNPQKIFLWYAIFWPLSPQVWIFVLIATILSTVFLVVQVKFVKYGCKNKQFEWETSRIIEYIGGSYLGEFGSTPKTKEIPLSIKVFLIFWLFTSFIIICCYLSMLFSFLTFPVLERIPETGEELAANPNFKIGITYLGGALVSLMRESKVPMMMNLAGRMELNLPSNCIRKAKRSNNYFCIGYEIIAKVFINTEGLMNNKGNIQKPPVQMSSNHLFSQPCGFPFPKQSPLAPNVAEIVGRATTAGLGGYWDRQDIWNLRKKTLLKSRLRRQSQNNTRNKSTTTAYQKGESEEEEEDSDNVLLTLKHLKGAFIVLIAGLIIACISLVVETCYELKNRMINRIK